MYSPEGIANINYAAPIGMRLCIKLNQQDTEKATCVSVDITNGNIGIDGTRIWAENESFPVGSDVVIEYYGELENVSDDINYNGKYNPYYGVYDNKIVYKINYIKSIAKITADE